MSHQSTESKVRETNSGIKKRGNWEEISDFGKRVRKALKGVADSESLEKFEKWRPKLEEAESDVKRKTVDEAVLNENGLEEDSDGVRKDLKDASGKVVDAGKKGKKRKPVKEDIAEASEDVAKPFYSGIAKIFRSLERIVYDKISLRFNPYYLDTDDFSVDIRDRKKGEFEMRVSVPKENIREKLEENLEVDS